MENAVQALKMSAAVLIFIIAIGTTFYMFGVAKNTADAIITMRDKQAYLESAEVDGGILYTSSSQIKTAEDGETTKSKIAGMTIYGDRIVNIDDVISTICRYADEKYAVTLIDNSGNIKARFDTNIESIMQNNSTKMSNAILDKLALQIKYNLQNKYKVPTDFNGTSLKGLYELKIGSKTINGAPWLGNNTEIQKRINADINGGTYTYNKQTYTGKNLLDLLKDKTIIEVVNEIDESTYLIDGTETTDLLKQYEMPTVEVIYIIQ